MLINVRIAALVVVALAASSVSAAPTVRFKTLHQFQTTDGIGSGPGPLVKGVDGRLYGVMPVGGQHGKGTLFSITPRGDFRLLHSFSGGADGEQPTTLFRDPQGNIYGATVFGGLQPHLGVLFSLGADGTPTVVHNFTDGGQINGSKVVFKNGSFYGTAAAGGIGSGSGSVYRFTPPSTVETIYQFSMGADQGGPYFGLSKARGVFYGTTYSDLFSPTGPIYGTAFRVTDAGELTVLHTFTGADGSRPVGPPVRAADGNFYGVTSEGGEFGCGTIYRIDSTGAFTLVHTFTNDWNAPDGGGCTPFAALLKGKDGRLYGSTSRGGGEYGMGLIFRLSVSGEFEVLHKFASPIEGGNVMSPLVERRTGTFFGMTTQGLGNTGTVFKLIVRESDPTPPVDE